MADGDSGRWLLRVACVAAFAALPLTGAAQCAVLVLLLPLACACLRGAGERAVPAAMAACMAFGAWQTLPGAILPAVLVWCAGCGAMAVFCPPDAHRQGVAWLALGAIFMAAMTALLYRHYQCPLHEGLAGSAVAWIDAREDAPAVLIRAYQNGLAALPPHLAKVPALRFGDKVVMTEETRTELVRSLRTTLSLLLSGSLAGMMGTWLALNALLCTALPDMLRWKLGGLSDLPPFDRWQLTRSQAIPAALLGAGLLVRYLSGDTALGYAGSICGGMFAVIFGAQGVAVLWAMMKARASRLGWVWLALGLALCSEFFVIMGVIDQFADFRRLRRPPEE